MFWGWIRFDFYRSDPDLCFSRDSSLDSANQAVSLKRERALNNLKIRDTIR